MTMMGPSQARRPAPALALMLGMSLLAAVGVAVGFAAPAAAQATAPATAPAPTKAVRGGGAPFAGFGGNSKEPIKIDANKLEVFDKENRGVYSGDVVAVQGQSTLRCTTMTIHYTTAKNGNGAAPPSAGQNAIRRIDCNGPVSVLSGTMSATAAFMTYDAPGETVTFTGNVVIADCDNVQRGERAVYDVKTGRATVDAGSKGRVQGIFTPGSDEKKKAGGDCGARRN